MIECKNCGWKGQEADTENIGEYRMCPVCLTDLVAPPVDMIDDMAPEGVCDDLTEIAH